jgi:hypothetical protein
MQQPFAPVAEAECQTFGPQEEISDPVPGDFILTHGRAWTSKLIRFGQRLRFRGHDAKYARWNHAAIFVDERGDLVEALGGGVQRRNIFVYKPTEYTVVSIDTIVQAAADRRQVVRFAEWSLGQPYGFLTIASIAYGLLTGGTFTFGFDGQHISSGLVARALERTGAIFNRAPTHIMPADLAKYFQVEPPPPGTPKGAIPAA